MATDKAAGIESTNADMLLAGDMGCLLNIAGRLSRMNVKIAVHHVAEILAGRSAPPIGIGTPNNT
jgi:L-lactate dehydrogenase complex protein LldE